MTWQWFQVRQADEKKAAAAAKAAKWSAAVDAGEAEVIDKATTRTIFLISCPIWCSSPILKCS